jgi:hypothetical protein
MADFTVSSDIDTFMQSADKAAMRTNMDLGTAASKDFPAAGDAAAGEVVLGNDSRLTDARTPTSHTHTASEITDFDTEVANNTTVAANTSKLAGIEAGAEVNNISDTNATDLTDGGDSTLHYHSADRSRANHTGTQTLSTISDAGTIASQNSNSVTITGGSITGITDLAVADGGTGAGTAAGARTNLEVYSTDEVDAKVATKETAGGVQMSVVSGGGRIDTGITGVASYLLGGIYTYSFWFKDENLGSSSLLLGSESWSGSGFAVYIHSSTNQFRFQLTTALSNNLILNLGSTYRDGKWRQFTFTSDWSSNDGTVAPVTSFYIDGQSVSPQTLTSYNGTYDYVGNSGVEKLWIGNLPGNNAGCSSGIRGFRVFNRALSAFEVADLYESGTVAVADRWGVPGGATGCIADLPLDEGIGYQFHDRSSNHYDALASTSGVTHLVPKTEGYIRDFNVDAYNGGSGNVELVDGTRDILPNGKLAVLTRLSMINQTSGNVTGTLALRRTDGGTNQYTVQTFSISLFTNPNQWICTFPVTETLGDALRENIAVTASDADATAIDFRIDYKLIKS